MADTLRSGACGRTGADRGEGELGGLGVCFKLFSTGGASGGGGRNGSRCMRDGCEGGALVQVGPEPEGAQDKREGDGGDGDGGGGGRGLLELGDVHLKTGRTGDGHSAVSTT